MVVDPLAIRDLPTPEQLRAAFESLRERQGPRCPYSPNTRAGTTIGQGRWVEPWPLRATRTLAPNCSFRRLITPIGWSSIGVV